MRATTNKAIVYILVFERRLPLFPSAAFIHDSMIDFLTEQQKQKALPPTGMASRTRIYDIDFIDPSNTVSSLQQSIRESH
jgi:hypothetical protein